MSKNQSMSEKRIRLLATDLDGTLLKDDKTISDEDLNTLFKLSEKKVICIAATGRSLFKVNDVLAPNIPFDFIVFSSGGGVYNWKEKKLLVSEHFEMDLSINLCRFLVDMNLNFVVFKPIPDNNQFLFNKGVDRYIEFENYLERHNSDFSELNIGNYSSYAGQFMSIIPNDELLFSSISQKLNSKFDGIRVIRTTSPIDKRYIWLEIFPDSVSKGHGIRWICDRLGILYSDTVGIGNDYNDTDMLDFVEYPFILGHSPFELQVKYRSVKETNNQSGFSKVIEVLGI
jgi:Cof subfamily protein (haloacid dehalogenase superfamily)